jgi:hypothetical protein
MARPRSEASRAKASARRQRQGQRAPWATRRGAPTLVPWLPRGPRRRRRRRWMPRPRSRTRSAAAMAATAAWCPAPTSRTCRRQRLLTCRCSSRCRPIWCAACPRLLACEASPVRQLRRRVCARASLQRQVPGMRMPAVLRGLHCRTRIGRGGRLLLDRVHPLTREPYTTHDPLLVAPRQSALQASTLAAAVEAPSAMEADPAA